MAERRTHTIPTYVASIRRSPAHRISKQSWAGLHDSVAHLGSATSAGVAPSVSAGVGGRKIR
jgi:hypothetical protein